MIVKIFPGNPHGVVNLQVYLDGNDAFWATSRHEGPDESEWQWPERLPVLATTVPQSVTAPYEHKT
jgi:hypothetical protein